MNGKQTMMYNTYILPPTTSPLMKIATREPLRRTNIPKEASFWSNSFASALNQTSLKDLKFISTYSPPNNPVKAKWSTFPTQETESGKLSLLTRNLEKRF